MGNGEQERGTAVWSSLRLLPAGKAPKGCIRFASAQAPDKPIDYSLLW